VVNVCDKVMPLFRTMDKHSLKNMVSQTAYSMEGHIRGSTQYIEFTPSEQRSSIT